MTPLVPGIFFPGRIWIRFSTSLSDIGVLKLLFLNFVFVLFYFIFWWNWGSNSVPCTKLLDIIDLIFGNSNVLSMYPFVLSFASYIKISQSCTCNLIDFLRINCDFIIFICSFIFEFSCVNGAFGGLLLYSLPISLLYGHTICMG